MDPDTVRRLQRIVKEKLAEKMGEGDDVLPECKLTRHTDSLTHQQTNLLKRTPDVGRCDGDGAERQAEVDDAG